MKYIRIECDKEPLWTELGGEDHVIRQIIMELDENNYAVRQIIVDENNECHYSCLEDCLAEGQVREDEMDEKVLDLPCQVFESMWEDFIAVYKGDALFIPHKKVCYQVLSYDHCNMWLVVGECGM